MVKQYPHQLRLTSPANTEPVLDSNGQWVVPVAPGEFAFYECRAETAKTSNGGNVVKSADGQNQIYKWDVYAPKTCPKVPEGTHLIIYQDGSEIRAEGTVKQFVRDQFNCKIWL